MYLFSSFEIPSFNAELCILDVFKSLIEEVFHTDSRNLAHDTMKDLQHTQKTNSESKYDLLLRITFSHGKNIQCKYMRLNLVNVEVFQNKGLSKYCKQMIFFKYGH